MKNFPTYIAIFSLIVLLPGVLFAAEGEFIPLVGLPYIGDGGGPKHFGEYVKALYYAAISIGAFLAVIKIIFAGVKYMLTDVVTTKGDAKKDIYGALIGLLIVVGAVLILQTINPRLLEIKLFNEAPVPYINTGSGGIENPYNINPGDSTLDTDGSINKTQWADSCKNNGGVFSTEVESDGFNIFTTLRCDYTPSVLLLLEEEQCALKNMFWVDEKCSTTPGPVVIDEIDGTEYPTELECSSAGFYWDKNRTSNECIKLSPILVPYTNNDDQIMTTQEKRGWCHSHPEYPGLVYKTETNTCEVN